MRISRSVALIGSFQFGISGPLDCHIYAVRGPAGAALIDAGAGTHTDRVLANLRTDFETEVVDDLAITHCHLDPCGGAASLHQKTGCRVIVPEQSRAILEAADEESAGLCAAREKVSTLLSIGFSPVRLICASETGTNSMPLACVLRGFTSVGTAPTPSAC